MSLTKNTVCHYLLLLAFIFPPAIQATAFYSCQYGWAAIGGPNNVGTTLNSTTPCNLSFNEFPISTNPFPLHVQGTAQNDATPLASVSALAESSTAVSDATSRVRYEVELGFIGSSIASLTGIQIPVFISSFGQASASVSTTPNLPNVSANGTAFISVAGENQNLLSRGEASVCASTQSSNSCGLFPSSSTLNFFEAFFLTAEESLTIRLLASVNATGGSQVLNQPDDGPAMAAASASIDPFIWIDPEFLVEVDGEMVLASEIFTLTGSDGIGGINVIRVVPILPAVWLFGSALLTHAIRLKRSIK